MCKTDYGGEGGGGGGGGKNVPKIDYVICEITYSSISKTKIKIFVHGTNMNLIKFKIFHRNHQLILLLVHNLNVLS